ncbi:MAG: hypothetical protein ACK484_11745 [Sphingobacteriales bacterium]|jgi:hypothetical protein
MQRWIKPVIIGLAGLFIVMLGFSLVLPDHVMTSKWVMVKADQQTIIQEIKNLENWKSWNLLLKDAQNVQVSDSTLNWTSLNGKGSHLRVDTVNDKGVSTTLSFNQGRPFISGFSVEKREKSDSTQVVWYIIEELKWYPWEKFYGMMAADMKGPLMEASLALLKTEVQGRR